MHCARCIGLIPAHAGKTGYRMSAPWRRRAHPRSRGENVRGPGPDPGRPGSSPLTRGKRMACLTRGTMDGLIPAHAGKTSRRSSRTIRPRAHPRSRGENKGVCAQVPTCEGSSPLTRGKPRLPRMRHVLPGLIPAHAGKTPCASLLSALRRAHPRSRGENKTSTHGSHPASGSSPLTRGKHCLRQPAAQGAGLIPAHAGKTIGIRP